MCALGRNRGVVLGSPIFGLGTWRAGVAPRIGALLLVVGGPALLVISEIATLGLLETVPNGAEVHFLPAISGG